MSKISSRAKEKQFMNVDHQKYLTRISKTLYYGKLPKTDRLSLPVTELAAEIFSKAQRGKSLNRLHCNDAARISNRACISPCSLVLAMLYLDRLKLCNPEYLERTAPSDLFLVSVMVSSKFLFEDADDDVYMQEWAESAGVSLAYLVRLERDFLNAIDWKVYMSEFAFWMKLNNIEITLANKQARNRGFYTYTELSLLFETISFSNFFQYLSAVSFILTMAYTLGFLTIIGSVLITNQLSKLNSQSNDTGLQDVNDIVSTDFCSPVVNDLSRNICEIIEPPVDLVGNSVCEKCGEFFIIDDSLSMKNKILETNASKSSTLVVFDPEIKNCSDKLSSQKDVQNVGWDWWNIPIMCWLAKTSQLMETLTSVINFDYRGYLETSASNMKAFELEDQIHKATKTRIQDQMEHSWHKEWTDTIKSQLIEKPLAYIVSDLKY